MRELRGHIAPAHGQPCVSPMLRCMSDPGIPDLLDRGHIFISYLHEDRQRVDRLEVLLKEAGLDVWRDRDKLWAGQDWKAEIRRAITTRSLVFIACFSEHTGNRDKSYQNEELVVAAEQIRLRMPGRPWLIPVRFADCPVPEFDLGAGRTFASLHRVDLFDGSWEPGIVRLIRAVFSIAYDLRARPVVARELGTASAPDEISSALPETARLLIGRAEETAALVADPEQRTLALARIIKAIGDVDSRRAGLLIDRAADVILDIPHQHEDLNRSRARAALALAAIPVDPARAQDVARDITEHSERTRVLLAIAEAVSADDPHRASWLLSQAEVAARAVDPIWRISALLAVARAVRAQDPARADDLIEQAEQSSHSLQYKAWTVGALLEIARALRPVHPAGARSIIDQAESIAIAEPRPSVLRAVAEAVRGEDPARAADLAEQVKSRLDISARSYRRWEDIEQLAACAAIIADLDPHRAGCLFDEAEQACLATGEAFVRENPPRKARGLLVLAKAVCEKDPLRARRLITLADREYAPRGFRSHSTDEVELGNILASLCDVMAPADPGGYADFLESLEYLPKRKTQERILPLLAAVDLERAQMIALVTGSSDGLAAIAELVAPVDPRRAEVIALGIPGDVMRAGALACIGRIIAMQPDHLLTTEKADG